HTIDLRLEGVSATLDGLAGSAIADGLRSLGVTKVSGDARIAYRRDEKRRTLVLEELRMAAPEIGDLSVHARLSGLDPERLQQGIVVPLRIEELRVDYRDHGLLARAASLLRAEEPGLRREVIEGIVDAVRMLEPKGHGNEPTLRAFLAAPGSLH